MGGLAGCLVGPAWEPEPESWRVWDAGRRFVRESGGRLLVITVDDDADDEDDGTAGAAIGGVTEDDCEGGRRIVAAVRAVADDFARE